MNYDDDYDGYEDNNDDNDDDDDHDDDAESCLYIVHQETSSRFILKGFLICIYTAMRYVWCI